MSERIYYSRAAELEAKRRQMLQTSLFLMLGLGIGAVLALLFAPNSGEQVRKDIAQAVEERVGASREASDKAIHRLEREFADLRKRLEDR